MDIVFSDLPAQADGSWTLQPDRDFLSAALRQASAQSAHLGRSTLASIVLAVDISDPLRILQAFQQVDLGECIYWEQASQHKALVSTGTATTLQATGPDRFTALTAAWRSLQEATMQFSAPGVVPGLSGGPILLGGFSFDTLATPTPLWDDFPAGLLILPQLLFHIHGQQATLTLNTLVSAYDNTDASLEEIITTLTRLQSALACVPSHLQVHEHHLLARDLLPQEAWQDIVAHAVSEMKHGAFAKVVLARAVEVSSEESPFDIVATLARLRMSYPGAYVFSFQRGARHFVGATPERLIYGQDGQLRTMALAGSAPRGKTPEEDRRLGTELLHSQKNKIEHEVVSSMICETLSSFCSKVWVADAPHLLQLKNIQHLETPIVGELLPGHCVLEALQGLHPTPAVGGFPRHIALAYIRQYEQLDRGWYASPVGWIDANGNGEFAVALRSGLVDGNRATLFAGCGIVADSQPESEYAESCLKLQVMLRGLGGED